MRKKVIKHQLLSLIGHLAQAAKVWPDVCEEVANSKKELYHWLYLYTDKASGIIPS